MCAYGGHVGKDRIYESNSHEANTSGKLVIFFKPRVYEFIYRYLAATFSGLFIDNKISLK